MYQGLAGAPSSFASLTGHRPYSLGDLSQEEMVTCIHRVACHDTLGMSVERSRSFPSSSTSSHRLLCSHLMLTFLSR